MKNLKLSSEISLKLELQLEEEVLLFSALDIERNRLFFVSSANIVYVRQLPLYQKGKLWNKDLLPLENDPVDLEPGDNIISLDYLMEKEALLIGTSNGYLLLHAGDGSPSEVVGQVEGGVKCIAPSPDGGLIAVVTGFGKLLVMTHDWDLLYETTIDDADVDVREATGSTIYRSEISLSWRGDGKYFATLSELLGSSSSQKKVRIWDRDSGALHAVTESKAFMGAALDWMPSGAKVAAAFDRKTDNKGPLIVFFERNGLERSSFSISELTDATIEELKWNCSSDLLGAVVRCERYDAIKIWSFSNNHWYLKQEIRYPKSDRVKFMWDPMKPLHLISWSVGGKITTYSFIWITAITANSIALVIDNSNVKITPLALSLMPPPMYLFNLKFPTAVRDIAFYSKSLKNQMAACLSNGSLCIVEFPASDTWEELEGKEFFVETSSDVAFGSLKHLIWLDSHILLGVSYYETGDTYDACLVTSSSENELTSCKEKYLTGYSLQEIELVCSEDCVPGLVASSGWRAKVSCQLSLEGPVVAIVPNPAKRGSAFVQLEGGRIVEYTSKLGITGVPPESYRQKLDGSVGFSSSCPWMHVASVYDNGVMKPLPFGLDDNGRLHISGQILCNNCSGFSFYSNSADQMITHLILTTKQDLLFIVNIDDILHGNPEAKYENFIKVGIRIKEENRDCINIWERGAKLVGVLHGDAAGVILQTTRGNLECIYPRKLVLASIVNALVERRFRDAFLMVRRHRIDFNIIVDHCGWQNFLQYANEFVKQVKDLGYVTEFVCSVKNENVTDKLYRNIISLPYPKAMGDVQAANVEGFYGKSKISSILQAIREALEDQVPESSAKELCILTTLARSEPPAMEEALKRIKMVREMELQGVDNPSRKSYPSAEEAIKHLLWLTNSEAVYEAALGLYDLNLAAIVALNSQKDPKEFLPFLQGLEHMPPLIMKYQIDLRLQRYESALKNIVSAGDVYYEDSINLMKNNPQLFPLGIQLVTDPFRKSQVLEAWGDHLYGDKCFEDAATAYLCCSSLEKALKAYRACGQWKGVLTVAGFLKLGKEEVLRLANELCEELQALGRPAEAAKIALEYCNDVAGGIQFLISAREWEEALRIGFFHRRDDLISEVKCAALECAGILISEYEDGLEKVGKYLARYLAVRQRRLLLAAKLQAEDRSMDGADDETASDTSSNFSGMSAYTTGTRRGSTASTSSTTASKSRQMRHQKKGGKIRAGSPGEEMALVEHLKGMSLTAGAQHELKSLLVALVMLGNEETARKLQRIGDSFQLSQRAAVRLAEDTISNDNVDEKRHTLEHYIQKVRGEQPCLEAISWQSKVLLSS